MLPGDLRRAALGWYEHILSLPRSGEVLNATDAIYFRTIFMP